MDISRKIKDVRQAKGFSQEYVAGKSNIEISIYNSIENGEIDVTFKQLESIAIALEYELVDLISHQEHIQGIRNYFYNHSGYQGVNIHVQGIDQEEIRRAYKELYSEQLERIPKLEKLLKENSIDYNF